MLRWFVVVALIAACRDHDRPHDKATAVVSVVPRLLISEDGVAELVKLDKKIELQHDPGPRIGLLLVRAMYRGRVEDYQEALQLSAAWVASAPDDHDAWETRTQVLTGVHDFAEARLALEHVRKLSIANDDTWNALEISIDEAGGPRDRSRPARAQAAKRYASTLNLTSYAGTLALDGQFDDAIALVAPAAKALRDNSPEILAWCLFQWGRLYEQKGDMASARAFFQAAHDRLPGYVEANAHLALTLIATGDSTRAKTVVTAALAGERHPSLLELAAQLGLGSVDDARAAWERYVGALPKAFADHAARFYLGVGHDPKRALELAGVNLANREVPEARELVVQAALAAGDTAGACDVAAPLATAPLRAHRFAAWQAFSRCGRDAEANRLAKDLGITP